MKTGHCMLNKHKNKIDQDTQSKCEVCLVNETPTHYLLHCNKFGIQKAKLMKNISDVLRKNSLCPFNVSIEELLGEDNINTEDSKTLELNLEDILIQQKNKFETEDSKLSPSQICLHLSLFYFIYVFCYYY